MAASPAIAGLAPEAARRKIAYVLSLFPSYDETFILREMKALKERGVAMRVFSLRSRRDPVIQEDARLFMPVTRNAAYLLSGEVLRAVGGAR